MRKTHKQAQLATHLYWDKWFKFAYSYTPTLRAMDFWDTLTEEERKLTRLTIEVCDGGIDEKVLSDA